MLTSLSSLRMSCVSCRTFRALSLSLIRDPLRMKSSRAPYIAMWVSVCQAPECMQLYAEYLAGLYEYAVDLEPRLAREAELVEEHGRVGGQPLGLHPPLGHVRRRRALLPPSLAPRGLGRRLRPTAAIAPLLRTIYPPRRPASCEPPPAARRASWRSEGGGTYRDEIS